MGLQTRTWTYGTRKRVKLLEVRRRNAAAVVVCEEIDNPAETHVLLLSRSQVGDARAEVRQAKAFADQHGQLYFGWATPPDTAVESAPAKPVATADGRQITTAQMLEEIDRKFSGGQRDAGASA